MTKNDRKMSGLEPENIRVIDSLETLKVVADPLRLKILELLRREPQTVKQLAAAMDVPIKKLYYHINLLEEHALIRVTGTRIVSGIIEKQYQVTAYRLTVDRSLLSPASEVPGDSLDAFLSMILDHTKSGIAKSVRAGLVELGEEKSLQQRGLVLGRIWMRLSPARADAFLARLKELQEEYVAPADDSSADTHLYEFVVGMYPTEPPDNSSEL
jgi:DNA-binding transcriptional ArsR family regulator